jgi:hypothetical protein
MVFGDCLGHRVSAANIGLFMGQADQVMTGGACKLDQMASDLAASAKHHDPRSHGTALVKRAATCTRGGSACGRAAGLSKVSPAKNPSPTCHNTKARMVRSATIPKILP